MTVIITWSQLNFAVFPFVSVCFLSISFSPQIFEGISRSRHIFSENLPLDLLHYFISFYVEGYLNLTLNVNGTIKFT